MKNRQLPFDKLSTHQNIKAIDFANNGGVFVIPYSILSGGENISESGIISGQKLDNASFLEYVFTGRSAIKVCWDNSTLLSPYTGNSNLFQYDFSVGDYFIGKPLTGSCSSQAEISSVEGNDDFLAMKSAGVITLHFEYEEPISFEEAPYLVFFHKLLVTDEYKRKFYKIPELGGNKFYYITNATPIFEDTTGRVVGEEVEFSTVLDQLQNSGKAIEQYIQNNAPGEPYASPQINLSTDENGREIKELVLNESTSTWGKEKLIKYIQVEQQGTSALGGITVIGRKIQYDSINKKWYSQPWSFLLPSNWYQFNNNPLNHTSLPTSTFAFLPDFFLKMSSTKDWIDTWKALNDSLSTMSFAGRIRLGAKRDWIKYNAEGKIEQGNPFVDEHCSNYNALCYWDPNWKPYAGFQNLGDGQSWQKAPYDMKGMVYTNPTLSYKFTDSFTNTFIKNSFVCLNNLLLPTSFEQKKPYRVSNMPIIGGMVAGMIGDRTINPNTYSKFQERLGCFIDRNFLHSLCGIVSAIDNGAEVDSFLNALGGEMIPKYFGSTCYNTTLCYKLSDTVNQTQHGVTQNVPTVWFGQTKKADGTYIFSNNKPCNLQDDFTVLNCDYGFVIDKVIVNSLFSGNIRVTCYGENFEPEYATTVVSNAKWLDNAYNNWTSELTLGCWPEEYVSYFYNPTWPETPTYQETEYPINWVIDRNINDRSAFDSNTITWEEWADNVGVSRQINKINGYTQISGKNAFEQSIEGYTNYYAYGVGYTDRDDFIDKNEALSISINNSNIGISCLDEDDPTKLYNKDFMIPLSNIVFPLQAGVYEYNKDIIFGWIGDNNDDNIDNYEVIGSVVKTDFGGNWGKCIDYHYRQAGLHYSHAGGVTYIANVNDLSKGEYTDLGWFKGYITAHIKLILGESLNDGLQLQITNVKHIIGERKTWTGQIIYAPSGNQGDQYITRQAWAPHFVNGMETGKSYIFNIYGYDIISRLNLHLVFNGMNKVKRTHTIILFGGSIILTGVQGTAGQDTLSWSAKYDGTDLPSSSIQLYNAPNGVTITNGKISWDNTLITGNYNFYIYAQVGETFGWHPIFLSIAASTTLAATLTNTTQYDISGSLNSNIQLVTSCSYGGSSILNELTTTNCRITAFNFVSGQNVFTMTGWDKGEALISRPSFTSIGVATYDVTVQIDYGGQTWTGSVRLTISALN